MTEANQQSPDQNSGKKKQADEPILVQTGATEAPEKSIVVTPKTKFFRGKWSAKSSPNDPECVRLSVNGEVITFQRSVECIVPEPYLEVAQHAIYPKFKQEPGKGRKVATYIDRFPFSKSGEATFAEFRTAFLAGSKKTREAVAQHGLNIPIEDSVPQLS